MNVFDYKERPEKLLTPEVVNQLGKLHELKGRQELFIEAEHTRTRTSPQRLQRV